MSRNPAQFAKRILLVEDDSASRTALSQALEQAGHEVRTFPTAEEAASHMATGQADVAILDVGLPGRLGDEFAAELKKKWPHTRVIFVTGEADVRSLKRACPTSVAMRKPLNVERLLHFVNS